jgi:predicted RNA-binding Zn ribbon-like protein
MSQSSTKSPFEYTGGALALDFANTVNNRMNERREELLTDYGRLVQWAEGANAITAKTGDRLRHLAGASPRQAQPVVRHAIQLREAIHAIFSAVVERQKLPGAALAQLNSSVQSASEHARITHANGHFAWEWILPDSNLDSMLWPVALAAAELLTSDDLVYVRHCTSETCKWLFLDKTKNHRRRWCEMKTCGNRDKARRYYHRQKAGHG